MQLHVHVLHTSSNRQDNTKMFKQGKNECQYKNHKVKCCTAYRECTINNFFTFLPPSMAAVK